MNHRTFGNVIVVAVVAAIWCVACTVYHAQLIDQKFVYAGMLMSALEVITNVWTLWTLGVAALLTAAYLVETASCKDRQVRAFAKLYG